MASSESSTDIRDNLIRLVRRNDWWLTTIMGVAALAFIGSLVFVVIYNRIKHVEDHRVKVELVTLKESDLKNKSVGANNVIISKAALDSIIFRLERHEAVIAEKYTSILEKREEEDNNKTIIMLVFGVIMSVAGFFGYSSISDIRKRVTDMAEIKATEKIDELVPDIAVAKAEEEAKKYCDDNINAFVRKYLNDNLQALINNKVKELFDSEGRTSIVQEITQEVNGNVLDYFKTEDWAKTEDQVIATQLHNFLSEDTEVLPSLVRESVQRILEESKEDPVSSTGQANDADTAQPKTDASDSNGQERDSKPDNTSPTAEDLFGLHTA